MTQLEIEQAVESIWALFRETDRRLDRRIEETDRRIEETDRRLDQRIAETQREIAALSAQMRATDQRIVETDRRLERHSKETWREIAALSAQIRAAEELFTGQWGRLLEALVKPGAVELFRVRGIPVNRSQERLRVRRGGEELEIDLLLVNGDALVVVEVKSTLRVDDVRTLLKDLKRFPDFIPEYRGYRRFGAVAALTINEAADRYAYRRGLFVLTLGRQGPVTLRNDVAFRPKDFPVDE